MGEIHERLLFIGINVQHAFVIRYPESPICVEIGDKSESSLPSA